MKTVTAPRGQERAEGRVLTLSVSLPQSIQVDEQAARELLTLALVQSGRLSQSQAAHVLGIGRYDLLTLMGRYGVPVVSLSAAEREQETRHLEELQQLRTRDQEKPRKTGRSADPSQTR